MYKVLHILGCSDVGGISTVVLNYYKTINHNKIHFDVAFKTEGTIGHNGREIQSLGAEVYYLPLKSKNLNSFIKALEKILSENTYDAVHVHEGTTAFVSLRIAKKNNVKQRIAHSHTSSPDTSIKNYITRIVGQILNYYYATNIVGCGRVAGERVFGKLFMKTRKALVLPNAVDTAVFHYDELLRQETRDELDVNHNYVIGMVGRLSEEKNILFALDLIEKIHMIIPNIVLIIAGEGNERSRIEKRITEKGIEEYVSLLGNRNDIYKLYNAFDLFLMPSIHEGFPVAAVEAMSCGLPVLLSDSITDELSFGKKVSYLPLSDYEKWVKKVLKYKNDSDREEGQYEIKKHHLSIDDCSAILENLYLKNIEG